MKPLLVLVAVVLCGSALSREAGANPRGLGPSAIEAARLKYNPPANFLAHYLPDDRYKIAGGVWKFVSTDLDTYYHVPSSPNMMRQPADRVIGFANAKEAEEAGYTADPTDGTAGVVAASSSQGTAGARVPGSGMPRGSAEEIRYLEAIQPLFLEASGYMRTTGDQLHAARDQASSGGADTSAAIASARLTTGRYLKQSRSVITRFDRLRPPARLRRLHSALREFLVDSHNMIYFLNRATVTGDMGNLNSMFSQLQRLQATEVRVRREFIALRPR